jgi:GNAT superfamily N-acetyltransferase
MFRAEPRPEDAEAIASLVRKTGVFNDAETAMARDLALERLERGAAACGYHFLFADGPAGLDGYVCFGPIPGTEARFELYWIAVDPAKRRSGLGRRLQLAAELAAKELGGSYLIAETSTRSDYAPAREFYHSLGYEHLADVPKWHADNDGLSVFGKRL